MAHEVAASLLTKAFNENTIIDTVLEEYVNALSIYVDYVYNLKKTCDIVLIEHAFDMGHIYPDLYGTADAVGLDKKNGILHVVDLKFGEGIVVEVKDNPQLEYYALGALRTLNFPCKKVEMTIVQPRAYHPLGAIRSHTVSVLDFHEIENNIAREAAHTNLANPRFKAGEWCLFCKASRICPVKHNAKLEAAKKEFAKKPRNPKKDFKDETEKDFKDETENAQTHPTPVSYTHLTLPTICSV